MLACSLRGEEAQFSLCLLRVLNPTNRAIVRCAAARQTSGGGPNHALTPSIAGKRASTVALGCTAILLAVSTDERREPSRSEGCHCSLESMVAGSRRVASPRYKGWSRPRSSFAERIQ